MRFQTGTGPRMTIRLMLSAFSCLIVSRSFSRSLTPSHHACSSTISGCDDLYHAKHDIIGRVTPGIGSSRQYRRAS